MMNYLVYQITNNINGRIYIGVHRTEDIDDGYMGSGFLLKRAFKKYGKANFTKTILAVLDNASKMFEMESVLVNENFVERGDTYNLVVGGENALTYVNDNLDKFRPPEKRKEWAKNGRKIANQQGQANLRGSQKHHHMMKNDPDYRAWYLQRCSNRSPTFLGKHHTDESKHKIGEANSVRQQGPNNSNYGKCWIYSETEERSISIPKTQLEEYMLKGWKKGRKMHW